MNIFKFDEERRKATAYMPLVRPEMPQYTTLQIIVSLHPGGTNWATGQQTSKGYRVSLTPCEERNGMISCTLLGDFKTSGGAFRIENATRYNKRRLLELAEQVEPKLQAIVSAFILEDKQALIDIIKNPDADQVQAAPAKPAELPKMKPLTKEVLDAFKAQGDTSNKAAEDIKVIAKFFTPDAQMTWYAVEFDPADRTFYGWANLGDDQCAELGRFSLTELEQLRGRLGLPVERDLHFQGHTLREVMDFKVR